MQQEVKMTKKYKGIDDRLKDLPLDVIETAIKGLDPNDNKTPEALMAVAAQLVVNRAASGHHDLSEENVTMGLNLLAALFTAYGLYFAGKKELQ
jgi:hypothetical protein